MEFMLLIHSDPKGFETLPADVRGQAMAAYGAYTEALKAAGVLRSSNRLHPSSMSTSVKVRDGKTEVLNGPFIETREELGGYYLVDVPDLDGALAWAARCPGASHGTVEVRPVWDMNAR
ncbi:MAG: YciI family protein [Burkholderiales bacterium]|nr:YciI family protein [Burkholderiales bacterium]